MRDPKRIRAFCNRLAIIWEMFPDLRFGQLITIVFEHFRETNTDPFYVEDQAMINAIEKRFIKAGDCNGK